METKKKVLLIIPAYNEQDSIVSCIEAVENYKQTKTSDYELDYVVINDGSTDGTADLLDDKCINHIDLVQNLGIGGAVQTGYMYARNRGYDIAVQFDGDGQHDIQSLDHVVAPILKGKADFVVGSRFVDISKANFRTTFMRRFGIRVISRLIKQLTGKRILDVTSGYRAANRDIIRFFAKNYPVSYPEPETLVHLLFDNFRIKEVHANMFERQAGASSIQAWHSVVYMSEVIASIIIAAVGKETMKS